MSEYIPEGQSDKHLPDLGNKNSVELEQDVQKDLELLQVEHYGAHFSQINSELLKKPAGQESKQLFS